MVLKKRWIEFSLIEKISDRSSHIFMFFILFYSAQLFASFIYKGLAPFLDISAAIFIISIFFLIHLIKRLNPITPLFLGIGFIPHILGLYSFLEGGNTLYGLSILNYHYDWIVHSFGMFCYSIVFCSLIYHYLKKGLKSDILVLVLVLFFMMGAGSFNETLEYVGYDTLGFGEGFLEFGAGDGLHDGGPWENASMDMIANLIGILLGTCSYLLFKKRISK